MRLFRALSARRLTRTATALVLATGVSIALSGTTFGSTAPTAAAERSCLKENLLQGWTEQTMQFFATGDSQPYPVQKVGESLIYNDHVFDENNQQVGHAVGYVTVTHKRPSDGHLISEYQHTEDTPDGSFSGGGIVDRTAMFQGARATFYVRGTSGAYKGKTGTFSWALVKVPPTFDTRVSLDLRLCG